MIKRKLAGIFLATTMIMGTLAGCGDSGNSSTAAKVNTDESAQGKVLNIYCWNTEFQDRFKYFAVVFSFFCALLLFLCFLLFIIAFCPSFKYTQNRR